MSITVVAGFVILSGVIAVVKVATTAVREVRHGKVVSSADSVAFPGQQRASTGEGRSLLQTGATEPTMYCAEPPTCNQMSPHRAAHADAPLSQLEDDDPDIIIGNSEMVTSAILQLQQTSKEKEEQDALSNSVAMNYASGDDADVV